MDEAMDIFDAVCTNDIEYVLNYLMKNGDPNACEDCAEVTLLHLAISYGNKETAFILLDHGADMFAEDKLWYQTPIKLAIEKNAIDVIAVMHYLIKLQQEYFYLCYRIFTSLKSKRGNAN
jgi:ankyrin repeat protein